MGPIPQPEETAVVADVLNAAIKMVGSQVELAKKIGCHQSNVARMVCTCRVSVEMAARIAHATGVDAGMLNPFWRETEIILAAIRRSEND